MLRSPRSKFTTSVHRAGFERLIQSEAFEEGSLAAMLELQREQPLNPSPNEAADAYNRMVGARRYLELLCTMYQKEEEKPKTKEQVLNYEAGV